MYNNILNEVKISYIESTNLEAEKLNTILEQTWSRQEKMYLVTWKLNSWSTPGNYVFKLLLNSYS